MVIPTAQAASLMTAAGGPNVTEVSSSGVPSIATAMHCEKSFDRDNYTGLKRKCDKCGRDA